MKYTINLVREIRVAEKKQEARRVRVLTTTGICFGILALAIFYSVFQILTMQSVLVNEKKQLADIEAQYRRYKATKMIVNKADIELLDQLQNGRIFWTKKLAAMAYHLPADFWVTKFGHDGNIFTVDGYGYITPQQEQLVVLDRYLNDLRADSTYCDIFRTTFFQSTVRADDPKGLRVSFEYNSHKQ